MYLKRLLLIVLFFTLSSFSNLHKYYVSLTQIDYINDSKSIQITMNIFLDDFEQTLNSVFNKEFRLDSKEELKDSNDYIQKYLQDHFELKVNDKVIKIHYLGKEYESDIVYLYIEVENVKGITTIEVKNSMLIDYFPKQQNLIKLKINNKFDSLLLTKSNDKGLLKF